MSKTAHVLKLRATIADKQAELLPILDERLSHVELQAALDERLTRAADTSGLASRIALAEYDNGVLYATTKPDGRIDLLPPLVALFGVETMRTLLSRFIQAAPDGASKEDRDARCRALEAEILELEKAEERAIRVLESEGVEFIRRADATPAVVLSEKP